MSTESLSDLICSKCKDKESVMLDETGTVICFGCGFREEVKVIEEVKKCECGAKNSLVTDKKSGIIVCNECGTVFENEFVDMGAEYRYYGASDSKSADPTRVTYMDSMLPQLSSCSHIGGDYRMNRLNRWITIPYKEKSLWNVFTIIMGICSMNKLNKNITNFAKMLYKEVRDKKLSRGNVRKGLIAACIYNSCKIHNCSRTPKQIAKMCDYEQSDVVRGCKKFNEVMKKNSVMKRLMQTRVEVDQIVNRFCQDLHLPYNIEVISSRIMKKASELGFMDSHTPTSRSSAILYYIAKNMGLNISIEDIIETCDVSEVTITKIYKKMVPYESEFSSILKPIKT